MKAMTRMATANAMQKNEVAFVEADGHIEVRSWWRHVCTGVEDTERVIHRCGEEDVEISLYPFPTIYGRIWHVGGCAGCGSLFYHQRSLPADD